jgi:alpha-tubulin suppressor-like RCC1 family protein
MAVTEDGEVYTWGSGYKGKLGHPATWSHADAADKPLPKKIENFNVPALRAICGGIHSGILTGSGELYSFECGSDGRLGHAESKEHRYLYREGIPRKIGSIDGYAVIDASFSYYSNICVAKKKNGKS